jgi:hypothetical protein
VRPVAQSPNSATARRIARPFSARNTLPHSLCGSIRSWRYPPRARRSLSALFHESKFVFLSCAQVSQASVVHTTVNVTLQEAWAHAPNVKKRETTHIVRCETETMRFKSPWNGRLDLPAQLT